MNITITGTDLQDVLNQITATDPTKAAEIALGCAESDFELARQNGAEGDEMDRLHKARQAARDAYTALVDAERDKGAAML